MAETPVPTDPTTEPLADPTTDVKSTPDEPLGKPGLDALKKERDAREAAEKRLKEFEDRDKTETQRQQEALEAAKAELAEVTTARTRAEVAAEKAVPTALLAGPASSSAEDIAAYADALIKFRGEKSSNPLHVPTEGKSPATDPSTESEFVSELFSRGD